MPRLSIIIPCYNAERFLARTLESVVAQDFQDWELIVVDDGSGDGSANIVQHYADRDARIRLIRQANAGAPSARNAGYHASDLNSDYLYFLDADDLLKPNALSCLIAYLDQHPHVGMAGCEYDFIDEHDNCIEPQAHEYARVWRYAPTPFGIRILPDEEPNTPFASLFCWCRIIPSASILRRSIYARTPGTNPELIMGDDIDRTLHCALHSEVHFLVTPLVQYRRHGSQLTSQPASIREGEQKLWDLWRRGEHLSEAQRRTVRQAWRFKQRRFVPHLWQEWGRNHRREGAWREAIVCYARSAKHRLRFA